MRWRQGIAVGLTYCGAVVGAGFATGREVWLFFASQGARGLVGVVLATGLLCWAGCVILDVTHRHAVYSYRDLLQQILAPRWLVVITDVIFCVTLLAGVGVMTAAAAAAAAHWRVNAIVARWVFLSGCIIVLRRGSRGYVRANSILVPWLVLVIALLCLFELAGAVASPLTPGPYLSSLVYVGYNSALAGVCLATLKEQLDRNTVWIGGISGGLLIGGLLSLVFLALRGQVAVPQIPLLLLAEKWLGGGAWIYQASLLAAVFTTALANMHGFASRMGGKWYWPACFAVAAVGYFSAAAGFGNLVAWLYPLLGVGNIVLLGGLCYYSFKRLL